MLSLLSGCGKSESGPPRRIAPAEEAEPEPKEDAPDASIGETPVLFSIEFPLLVERSVEVLEDGTFLWGEPQPVDGAEVCAIERRDSFAILEPYEVLEAPICVTTQGAETAWLGGLPAHSDLTITVEKDGYLPIATTLRLQAADLPRVSHLVGAQMVLFTEDQAALFQPSDGLDAPTASHADAAERGLLAIEYAMFDLSFRAPGDRGQLLSGSPSPSLLARDGQLALNLEPGGDALDLALPATQLLLEVPAGLYRAKVNHPRAYCEPQGNDLEYTFWGLSTAEPRELEVRVLPGRVTALEAKCFCVPPSPSDVPIDGRACIFSNAEPPDAGAIPSDAGAIPSDAGAIPSDAGATRL